MESEKTRPKRWLQCPNHGQLIAETFIPFKTPVDDDEDLPDSCKFSPKSLLTAMEEMNIDIGLVINLTYTSKYYDSDTFTDRNIQYRQILCRGHNEAPKPQERAEFIKVCNGFLSKYPYKKIGVHCTHGFNRTGFMICCFLYESRDWAIDAALHAFSSSRPPGIYKQDYIVELFKNYGDADDDIPKAPEKPDWEDSITEELITEAELTNHIGNIEFFEGITDVHILKNAGVRERIYGHCSMLCGREEKSRVSFPGSQPVSMDIKNMKLLKCHRYRVSWKADGCRYMLYIQDADNMYCLCRNLILYKIGDGLKFPRPDNLNESLTDTLLDGEMVLDNENGKKVPRYLIYDIICLNGNNDIRMQNFDARCHHIRSIMRARREAKAKNIIPTDGEPFKVSEKGFFHLKQTKKTLELKVLHEKDGLIFQPLSLPYIGGTCPDILKWKPPELNSIDFRLKIRSEQQRGCLPETWAQLFVSNKTEFMFRFKLTNAQEKEFTKYDNKIVECVIAETNNRRHWKILRERTDKLTANSFETAKATHESIMHPVTETILLNLIESVPDETQMK